MHRADLFTADVGLLFETLHVDIDHTGLVLDLQGGDGVMFFVDLAELLTYLGALLG